jgi:hypothetical protein
MLGILNRVAARPCGPEDASVLVARRQLPNHRRPPKQTHARFRPLGSIFLITLATAKVKETQRGFYKHLVAHAPHSAA